MFKPLLIMNHIKAMQGPGDQHFWVVLYIPCTRTVLDVMMCTCILYGWHGFFWQSWLECFPIGSFHVLWRFCACLIEYHLSTGLLIWWLRHLTIQVLFLGKWHVFPAAFLLLEWALHHCAMFRNNWSDGASQCLACRVHIDVVWLQVHLGALVVRRGVLVVLYLRSEWFLNEGLWLFFTREMSPCTCPHAI